jgi:predicted DNA-binding antitoxin AbrB/MazE fold protein
MPIFSEARYENKILKPSHDLPLREGESVIIEIKRPVTDRMYGLFSTDEKNADEIITLEGWD